MLGLVRVRRALISVSDKRDLIPFAKSLASMGVDIVSTGGTAAALAAAGIPVTPIEKLTGFPEMMDGRVKTLHPRVHGGLLGRRDVAEHVKAMEEHGIAPIDLVCVNLYPFEMTVRREGVQEHEAIEQIDIGGPSMLRSAAKNHEFVTVVTDPSQYDRVASEMAKNDGATTLELRRTLAGATFARTAAYDTAIAAWMSQRAGNRFPPVFELRGVNEGELRYGENPHQAAAVYRDPTYRGPNVVGAELLHGKPLSYNNLLDAAAALELVQDMREVAPDMAGAVVVKHTNPCGAALAGSLREAFARAYAGDPLAAFGGIVALNATVDRAAAEEIVAGEKFLEVVVAPGYEPEALALLQARWKNARLLAVGPVSAAPKSVLVRSIAGGFLAQEADTHAIHASEFQLAAGPAPSAAVLRDAAFLTAVVKHLKSNAVCIGRDGQLLGAGAGQMDRVASCRNAIEKSGARAREGAGIAVAASDAFFPFDDGPRLLIEAGVKCIVHPGGSKRDEDTFKLCNERGVTCLLTGVRRFRH
ncbi:MAG: bifunctional phosphoribosylaminoimidazolecarboxamide formyltransferase/IMP cyclohydrolase [Planctomycetaceae bacterium]|jgi:phosphoribosylaminoimidazolecarboxamide formyltransferase/IMP cyclohydrolase|nr:bifunctional phosphoribosylaminoimidazolecarboxamide formyltransferase/IMP cyclohydrolase [Planctomycetaceae bacterium]